MARLVGKTPDEVIGRRCYELVHGTSLRMDDCPVTRMLQSRHREQLDIPLGERWFHVTADPMLDEQGRLAGGIHVMRDVTEQKRADEELHRREAELAHMSRVQDLGEMAATLA